MELNCVCEYGHGKFSDITLLWDQCVAIGYAGRNQVSVIAHVEELKAIGVPAPERVPSMYWIDPERISTAKRLHVIGNGCSGEIEFFAAKDLHNNGYVTVASDHTDRQLETVSVSKAKQGCTKIIAPVFWALSEIRMHWDTIVLRSWVRETPDSDERLYQEGTLAELLPPEKLLELAVEDAQEDGNISYFSGTLPLKGSICYTGSFRMEMIDEKLGRRIEHSYTSIILPDRN